MKNIKLINRSPRIGRRSQSCLLTTFEPAQKRANLRAKQNAGQTNAHLGSSSHAATRDEGLKTRTASQGKCTENEEPTHRGP